MIYIIDTETTGIDEPQCIELAYKSICLSDDGMIKPTMETAIEQRFLPSKPIGYGAMATHHIQTCDLQNCAPHTDAKIPSGTRYIVGHNIDFDWAVLGSPDVRRICTLAMSRHIWPDIDSHKLGAIAYLLWPEEAKEKLQNAHSAAADVNLCCDILIHIVKMIRPSSIETLWQFSEKARIPTVMTFGKHRGERISDIPSSYKSWLLKQPDVDPYLVKALQGVAA